MKGKKWWIWFGAAACAAVLILWAVLYAGREEELPGGTLVKAGQEVMDCE